LINTKPTTSFVYDQNQNLSIKCNIKLTSNFKNYSFYVSGIFNQFVKIQNKNWIYSLGFAGYFNFTNNFYFIVPYSYFSNNYDEVNSNNLQVNNSNNSLF
jgi:hypothetical protein